MKGLFNKKTLTIFMSLILTATTACSSEKGQSNDTTDSLEQEVTNLTVYYEDDTLTPYFEYLNKQNEDVNYEFVLQNNESFVDLIAEQSTISEEPCDIFILNSADLQRAYYAGIVSEIKDDEIINLDNYAMPAIQAVTYEDKIYGYPFTFSTSVLVYNKQYVDKEPMYFTEIEDFANSFEVNEDTLNVQSIMSWDVADTFLNYAFIGGSINDFGENGDTKKLDICNDKSIEALSYYQSLNSMFYMDVTDDMYEDCLLKFKNGALCYSIIHSDDIESLEDTDVDYGIARIPDISEDIQSKALSNNYIVCVNPYSSNSKKAINEAKNIAFYQAGKIYETTKQFASAKNVTNANEKVYEAYEQSKPVVKLLDIGDYYTDLHICFYNVWCGENIEENLIDIENDMKLQFGK